MSCSSDSEGFWPRERMTVPSSLVVIWPVVVRISPCYVHSCQSRGNEVIAGWAVSQPSTGASRAEIWGRFLHTITVLVLISVITSQQTISYPYFGPAGSGNRHQALQQASRDGGRTGRTKREKASLNSETCSSVSESAWELSAMLDCLIVCLPPYKLGGGAEVWGSWEWYHCFC